MKRILLLALILGIGCTTKSQLNQEVISEEDEQVLVGEINWDGLNKEPYKSWFAPNYLNYQPDVETLDLVGESLENIEIVMFLGTWCEDSQQQIPQFYKILDYVGYDIYRMKVISLEKKLDPRRLVSPGAEEEEYNVEFVPSIIFYREGIELGRITEFPQKTLEKDMVDIILK